MKALKTNTLVNHPAYTKIITQYAEWLERDGKVNDKKFYEEVVRKEIPSYKMGAWYFFLKRFKTSAGIEKAEIEVIPSNIPLEAVNRAKGALLSNNAATQKLIQTALNISAERAQMILENPQLLSPKEALEIGLKAMKAQDSRIHAVGKIREDNREQEKFDRTFSDAMYEN